MRSLWLLSFAVGALLVGCGPGGPGVCAATGSGTVVVNVSGLPDGASARVIVTGPSGPSNVGATQTFTGASAGTYAVRSDNVAVSDPLIRTGYSAQINPVTFCLANGLTQTVTVTYAAIPTSNKLWATNGSGGNGAPLGFSSATLGASGSPAATVAAQTSTGRDITFDQDGNLWTMGGTDASLRRFPAGAMGTGGPKTADRVLDLKDIRCLPSTTAMAFDPEGNLWVSSTCEKKVFRVTAGQLATSGDVTPAVAVSTVKSAGGLAFDKSGNLWVTDPDDGHLFRFDAAGLSASTSTPGLTLTTLRAVPGDLNGNWLAFDAEGNLWANDFGGNVIYKITPAEQAGSGAKTITPGVQLTLPVGALLEGMAFDEAGGLWTAYSAGKFARIAPAQLGTSTRPGAPTIPQTIVASPDVGYIGNLAFYPAPAALPLHHALP
ncbi:MAG: Vgb family protein [Myxococcaceae bacterium]